MKWFKSKLFLKLNVIAMQKLKSTSVEPEISWFEVLHQELIAYWSYCYSLYLGLPYVRLQPLDGVLRATARLISDVPKFGHICEFMRDTFIGFQSPHHILSRGSTIAWRCILGVAPAYLSELLVFSSSCPGRQSLRSTSCVDYLIPCSYTATKQNRAFSVPGPSIWNGLPLKLRTLPRDLSSSFHSLLKTFFFAWALAESISE